MSVGLHSAKRRHHAERMLKRARQQYIDWGGFDKQSLTIAREISTDENYSSLERHAHLRRTTKCPCSRPCCGHRRKFGGLTPQERKAELAFRDELDIV